MIIDAHTHVKHGDGPRTEVPAGRIIEEMEKAGIDRSVIFAIYLPSKASHEMTLREYEKFPNRLIPFAHGLIHEGAEGAREVRRAVTELGFPGVKIHFGEFRAEKGRLPTYDDLAGLFETIAELDVPALVDLVGAIEVAGVIPKKLPALKFIIAHLGHPREPEIIDQAIQLCRAHENVWLDCSFCFVPEKIPEAIHICGANKIIFGSDGPSEWVCAADLIARIHSYNLPPEDEAAILSGNIRKLIECRMHNTEC